VESKLGLEMERVIFVFLGGGGVSLFFWVSCHPVRIWSCVHELLLVTGQWRKTKLINETEHGVFLKNNNKIVLQRLSLARD